jgi:hypothetical protein
MTLPRVAEKMPRSSLIWQQLRAGVRPASSPLTSAENEIGPTSPLFGYPSLKPL